MRFPVLALWAKKCPVFAVLNLVNKNPCLHLKTGVFDVLDGKFAACGYYCTDLVLIGSIQSVCTIVMFDFGLPIK